MVFVASPHTAPSGPHRSPYPGNLPARIWELALRRVSCPCVGPDGDLLNALLRNENLQRRLRGCCLGVQAWRWRRTRTRATRVGWCRPLYPPAAPTSFAQSARFYSTPRPVHSRRDHLLVPRHGFVDAPSISLLASPLCAPSSCTNLRVAPRSSSHPSSRLPSCPTTPSSPPLPPHAPLPPPLLCATAGLNAELSAWMALTGPGWILEVMLEASPPSVVPDYAVFVRVDMRGGANRIGDQTGNTRGEARASGAGRERDAAVYARVAASGPRPVRSLETRGFLLCKDYSFL
ncbi:hypothetical protein B0H13DRAFT_1032808 [Mycena leptocephala]|nr:hypothetical protein B0H13DRAFT_1032808 [Mycena leptocephala]